MAADPLRARARPRAAGTPGLTLRAAGLAGTLAVHALFAWMVFGPRDDPAADPPEPSPPRDVAASQPDRPEDSTPTAGEPALRDALPFRPGAPAGEFRTEAESAAYERGVAYELARQDALARLRTERYGEEIGALMRQPLPEAWRALEARAREGDALAADALFELGACTGEMPPRDDAYRRQRERTVAGLAPPDAAFVHGALDAELLGLEHAMQTCAAAGLDATRLVDLAQQRLGPDTAPPAGADPHAWMRYFQQAFPPADEPLPGRPGAEARAWLERLDARLGSEDWRELEREAPEDPSVVMRIAYCAMARCPEIPPEAWDEARHYIERAAEYGHAQSISHVVDRHAGARELALAHAWTEFGMWIIASGCFAMAQSLEYAQLARQRNGIAARMTAAQYDDARRHLAVLMQAHGNAALEAQGCRP